LAFRLVEQEVRGGSESVETIEARARAFIEGLPEGEIARAPITYSEWTEIEELAAVLRQYVARLDSPAFFPTVPGCGVVDASVADIIADDELVEIKAVARLFHSVDLRQALTYAAMLYASGSPIYKVTLLNPRRGSFVTVSLSDIAGGARGVSAVELLQDLVGSMSGLQVSA
jgi:hypothetical protein